MDKDLERVRGWIALALSIIPVVRMVGGWFGIEIPQFDVPEWVVGASGAVGVAFLAKSKPLKLTKKEEEVYEV